MHTHFAKTASEVESALKALRSRTAAPKDRDAEWQRVNSYVADVLKDVHVLYAKLARLQGDFSGAERSHLEHVSESVLALGKELSEFSEAFYEGKFDMVESSPTYGGTPEEPASPPAPAGPPPDFEVEVEVEGEEEPEEEPESQEQ